MTKILALIVCLIFCLHGASQNAPHVQIPLPSTFTNYSKNYYVQTHGGVRNQIFVRNSTETIQENNRHLIREAEADMARHKAMERQIQEDVNSLENGSELPSFSNLESTVHYQNAYAQLLAMEYNGFSAKKATFIVENAFYEGKNDYSEFEQTIERTGDFLREKMDELNLDRESNLAKNYLLFQFFADTLEVKSKGLKHFPFEYDFEDFWGREDWSNMFVQKLLVTGKGQCNSLPKLYLILAEEIGAEAHLALSPNHSYIKFPDDDGRWHNIELTNNMLTTDAFILNSGYVKAEAIQNKIYMHPMDERELLSNHFDQLAQGYIRKYGYDNFVGEMLETALEINPRNIIAQLLKANLQTVKLKYATERLGITQKNFQEIRKYPRLVQLYRSMMAQYKTVDQLGYAEMPQELYEKWLSSVGEQEQQQMNESINVKPIEKKND